MRISGGPGSVVVKAAAMPKLGEAKPAHEERENWWSNDEEEERWKCYILTKQPF